MVNTSILDLQRRRELYEYISQNPGLHMRDISRKMNVPFTSLKYHLNYLEKNGLVISREDGRYTRYYIPLEISENEKKILNCFRKRISLHIILWLVVIVQCSQKDLSKYLHKHPATIGFHLQNMKNAGIIEQIAIDQGVIYKKKHPHFIKRKQISSEKIYVLKDHFQIYTLLKKYKEPISDKTIVAGIIEYIDFFISDGLPKQVQNREDTINSVSNTFYGFFFPSSFCS